MRRGSSFSLLCESQDGSLARAWRVPRVAFFFVSSALLVLLVMSGLYARGLVANRLSRRGSAELLTERERLSGEIARLESKIALLREDLAAVSEQHARLAGAVGLRPLGDTVWEVGVGGRGTMTGVPSGVASVPPMQRLALLETDVDRLLRQARLQNESCEAMLDTLSARADARALIPSIRPIDSSWINSGFGKRPDPFTGRLTFHEGIDFAAPIGSPVFATADGVVVSSGFESGFGNIVGIRHGERIVTRYAHLSRSLVQRGERVTRGQLIAYSGKTGRATAPHLHYEVHVGGRPVNPLPYILESYSWR